MAKCDIIITLTDYEMRIAKWLGTQRTEISRAAGLVDRKHGPDSGEQYDIWGMEAELAFCRLANVWPDLTIAPQANTYDCSVNGCSIDVKATKYPNGKLMVSSHKAIAPADIYVLMVGQDGQYRYCGWMAGEEIISDSRLDKTAYIAEQKELNTSFEVFYHKGITI